MKSKQRTFAVGVLGADKGMFLALCAENREQGSVRKQALPGVIDGRGGEEENLYVRKTTFRVDGLLDFHLLDGSNVPIFFIIPS